MTDPTETLLHTPGQTMKSRNRYIVPLTLVISLFFLWAISANLLPNSKRFPLFCVRILRIWKKWLLLGTVYSRKETLQVLLPMSKEIILKTCQ